MFRHDVRHTGREATASTGSLAAGLKWSYVTGGDVRSSAAIGSDKRIYVGSDDSNLYCLNPDGSFDWAYATGGAIMSSPSLGIDGQVCVGSTGGSVHAIDSSGTLLWSYEIGTVEYSSPAIGSDGRVYIGSSDPEFFCLDSYGALMWSYHAFDSTRTSPAIDNDLSVYVGSDGSSSDSRLFKFDSMGALIWSYYLPDYMYVSSPAIAPNQRVYISAYSLYCFNADGSHAWTHAGTGWYATSPALSIDSNCYIHTWNGLVQCIDSAGSQLWDYDTGSDGANSHSSPAFGTDGTVYTGTLDNRVFSVASGGSLQWSYVTGDDVLSSPTIGEDGTIYAGSNDNIFYALYADTPTPTSTPTPTVTPTPTPAGAISGNISAPGQVSDIPVNAYDPAWTVMGSGNTNNLGHYIIVGLADGGYYVGTRAEKAPFENEYVDEYYDDAIIRPDADQVNVSGGETAGIDFALENGGGVSGNVMRQDTHETVINAEVLCYTDPHDSGTEVRATRSWNWGYHLQRLRSGSYYLKVGNPWNEWYDGDKGSTDPNDAMAVGVTAPDTTPEIHFYVDGTGAIAGTVTEDPSGTPIPDMEVQLFTSPDEGTRSFTRTENDGTYLLNNLADGTYYLRTWPVDPGSNYVPEWYDNESDPGSADPVTVTIPDTTQPVDFQLSPAGSISGKVESDSGNTVGNIEMQVYSDPFGPHFNVRFTNAFGKYTVLGLETGNWYVRTCATCQDLQFADEWYDNVPESKPQKANPVAVTAPDETTNVDFTLTPDPSSTTITGTATSAGTPIDMLMVTLHDSNDWGNQLDAGSATNASGDYTVEGLPTGVNYFVRTNAIESGWDYLDEWYDDTTNPANATPVPSGSSDIDFDLDPSGTIKGYIKDDGGSPLPGAQAYARDYDAGGMDYTGTADGLGNYEIKGLPYSDYRVRVEEGGYAEQYYYHKDDEGDANRVTVDSAETSGIDFNLQGVGNLSGSVTAPYGADNIRMILYDTGWNPVDDEWVGGGNYWFKDIPVGDYHVFARASEQNQWYIDEYYSNRYEKANADTATVYAHTETTGIDFSIETGGRVTGSVREDGTSEGILNATVEIYANTTDPIPFKTIRSWGGGDYDLKGIPAGNWYLKVNNTWNEWYDGGQGSTNPADAVQVTVTNENKTIGIDFWVSGVASISGHVEEQVGGADIPDMEVMLFYDIPGDDDWPYIDSRSTDSHGDYSFDNLAEDTYYLRTRTYDPDLNYFEEWYDGSTGSRNPEDAQAVSATIPEEAGEVDFYLEPAAAITGVVKSESGNPIGNCRVECIHASEHHWASDGWSELDGTYYILALDTDSYKLEAQPDANGLLFDSEWYDNKTSWDNADIVSVTVPGIAGGVDFSLAPQAGSGTISGFVGEVNLPIAGMPVSVHGINEWGIDPSTGTLTNNLGNYTIEGLNTSDEFYVRTNAEKGDLSYIDEWYDNVTKPEMATKVPVSASGIDFDLQAAGTIAGYVYNDSPTPTPLAGIRVQVQDYDMGGHTWEEWSEPDGSYNIGNLPASDYRVWVNDEPYVPEYYHEKDEWGMADRVGVTGGDTAGGISFTLQEQVSGTIRGYVYNDSPTPTPLENVWVRAQSYDHGGTEYGAHSKDSGYYEIIDYGIGDDDYRVWVNEGGYKEEFYLERDDWDDADRVWVPNGGSAGEVNFTMEEEIAGTITGYVYNSNPIPTPIVGIEVKAQRHDYGGSEYMDVSGPGGYYEITGVPPEDYRVWTDDENYLTEYYLEKKNEWEADPVTVPGGGTAGGVDFTLDEAGNISGYVYNDHVPPTPLPWIGVRAISYDHYGEIYWENSNEDGYYEFTGLAPDDYRVWTEQEGYVTEYYDEKEHEWEADRVEVNPGETAGDVDFTLEEEVPGTITGYVYNSNPIPTPLVGLEVRAQRQDHSGPEYANVSGAGGYYEITGVPPEDYRVWTNDENYATEYYLDRRFDWEADPVTVPGGGTAGGVDFTLDEAGKITGYVYNDSPIPTPLAGIMVQAQDYDMPGNIWDDMTEPDGSYDIGGLQASDYRVYVNEVGYEEEYYLEKDDWDDADRVGVSGGETSGGVSFTLTEQQPPGFIEGEVVSVPWGGRENLRIIAYDMGWNEVEETETSHPPDEGKYVFKLDPGDYYVLCKASERDEFFVDEYYNNAYWSSGAQAVTVLAGQTAGNVDFSIEEGGTIGGNVHIGSGSEWEGVFNAVVELVDTDKSTVLRTAQTYPSGWYEFRGLPASRDYYVRTPQWGIWYEQTDQANADLVHLDPSQRRDKIDFSVPYAGSISGKAYKNIDPSVGIPDMRVLVFVNEHDRKGTITGDNGNYTIMGIADGTYYAYVKPIKIDNNYLPEWYDNKMNPPPAADPVVVTMPNESGGVDFGLDQAGAITGTVLTELGNPVGGIEVHVKGDTPYGGSARTGASGDYVKLGLSTGTYYASVKGHQDFWAFQDEWYDNSPDEGGATPISVTVPGVAGDVDFSLTPDPTAGTISGHVTEDAPHPTPVPIPDLTIGFYDWPDKQGYPIASTKTDSSGDYTLEGLQTGVQFYVRTISEYPATNYIDEWYDDTTRPDEAQQVTVTQTDVDFALLPAGAIMGTVTDAEPPNGPMAGVWVACWEWYDDMHHEPLAYNQTKGDGTYAIPGLEEEDYRVVALGFDWYASEWYHESPSQGDATPVHVSPPDTAGNVDFTMEKGGKISGHVWESDGLTPIPDSGVGVTTDPYSDDEDDWITGADADADGYYIISEAIAPGSYYLGCRPPEGENFIAEYYDGAYYPEDATSVEVVALAVTENVNFTLDPGGSISGMVTAGGPADDVEIMAVLPDYLEREFETDTSGGGYYQIVGLLPDEDYYVFVDKPPDGYCMEFYHDAYILPEADIVHVTGTNDTSDIDFDLEQAAQISGIVYGPGDPPPTLAGATVFAINFRAQCYYRSTTTGTGPDPPAGYYEINGLPPTRYRVVAMAEVYDNQFYQNKGDWNTGDIVSLGEAESRGMDFTMDPGAPGTISGDIYYAGPQQPGEMLIVAAFPSKLGFAPDSDPYGESEGSPQPPPPISFSMSFSPGANPYSLSGAWNSTPPGSRIPPGSYWVLAAVMNTEEGNDPDEDDFHYYISCPVTMPDPGVTVTGIDIFIPWKDSPDSDGDGMPDDWETFYGGIGSDPDPTVWDADHDPDGDNWTNIAEYNAWQRFRIPTDPRNASLGGQGIELEPGSNLMGISPDVCYYIPPVPGLEQRALIPVTYPAGYVEIQDWNADGHTDMDDLLWQMGIPEYIGKITGWHPDPVIKKQMPFTYEKGGYPHNNLGYMAGGFGYWMEPDRRCAWKIKGMRRLKGMSNGVNMPLYDGWNVIGDLFTKVHYVGSDPKADFGSDESGRTLEPIYIFDYMKGLVYVDGSPAGDKVEAMIAFDEVYPYSHTYYDVVPPFLQTLNYVGPGMGLLIKIDLGELEVEDITLEYPSE